MAHCCVQILKPKKSVSLPIRSVHIKPSPVETDPTDMLLGLPRGKPRNPINRKLDTRRHAPQLAPENLPRAASDSWLLDRVRAHTPPWRPPRPSIYLAWESGGQPLLHAPPRATWVSDFSSTHRWTHTLLPHVGTLLLMSSDVTGWRYHSTSAATQAPPRQP